MKKVTFLVLVIATLLFVGGTMADTLVLPESVTEIEEEAFYGNTSLDEVVLPDGIVSIGARAFAESGLTKIHLPGSLEYIDESAFENADQIIPTAEPGTYAFDWLRNHHFILSFTDDYAYDATVDMAIFQPSDEIGLGDDSFVYYFELAEVDYWRQHLTGAPEWSLEQISGSESSYHLMEEGSYVASLLVDMPASPATTKYQISCTWDGISITGFVTVRYDYPATIPQGTNIADCYTLQANEENVISMDFVPSYSFGNSDRVGLENYTGNADWWFEGHDFHIIPYNEGTFTGYFALYAGNMYIGKNVVFRVGSGDTPDPSVSASWTDCYAITWNPIDEVNEYTVAAYLDASCETLYRTMTTQNTYAYFQTDVGLQYWFVLEYTIGDEQYTSEPFTASPIEPMQAPKNLAAEVDDAGKIHLTWDAVENATGYRIYFSDTMEWTVDTDWFSYEGEPGNNELQIDEGQLMYIWVCADNGNGPNYRAITYVYREEATESDGQIPGNDLLLPESIRMTPLSLEGVTNANILQAGQEYNDMVNEFNATVDRYNGMVLAFRQACDDLVTEAVTVTDGGVQINGVSIPTGVLLLLQENYEITGSEYAEDGYTILSLAKSSGEEATLYVTEYAMSLTPPARSRSAVSLRGTKNDNTDRSSTIAGIMADGAEILRRDGEKELQSLIQRHNEINAWYRRQAINTWNEVPELFDGMKADMAKNKARQNLMKQVIGIHTGTKYVWGGLATMAGTISVMDTQTTINLLNLIRDHGHPTPYEYLYTESRYLGYELDSKANKAINLLRSTQAMQIASITLSVVGNPVVSIGLNIAFEAASNWLKIDVERLIADVMRIEGALHYEIYGAIKDKDTQELLDDVIIYCDAADHDQMRIYAEENGSYHVEPLAKVCTLTFTRDNYEDLVVTLPENGPELSPDISYFYLAEMQRDTKGTVTGQVTDEETHLPIEGVTVFSGEVSTTTSMGGIYTLRLPEGSHRIYFDKEGYISDYEDVNVVEKETTEASKALQSCFVIKTREDLENVANNTGARYCLGANIQLDGNAWTPLPWFSGILDGRGYSITGMTITESADGNSGLFAGLTGGALIKNLIMTNAAVTVSGDYSFMNTGIICGNMLQQSSVVNSDFSGSISVSDGNVRGNVFAAGVSGMVTYGSIADCTVSVNIQVNYRDQIHVGGFTAQLKSGSLHDCVYRGTLYGNQTGSNSSAQVFVTGTGELGSLTANNCYVYGTVRADSIDAFSMAVGLYQTKHGENHASVIATSTAAKAFAAGCQGGSYSANCGSVSASTWNKNADAAGINQVTFGSNQGSVTASSTYGDTTAICVVDSPKATNSGSASASSTYGNSFYSEFD